MTEKASIRTNNPGAMWGGARADKWGATKAVVLNDGLGQGNNIAVFPTKVQGAAAQFDLWRASYSGLSLIGAIKKWSGGNSSIPYMSFLTKQTGIASTDIITTSLLAGGKGLALMKAQAQWEAGEPYPMTDAEWLLAQNMVFYGADPPKPVPSQPTPPKPEPKAPVNFWAKLIGLFTGAKA